MSLFLNWTTGVNNILSTIRQSRLRIGRLLSLPLIGGGRQRDACILPLTRT